MTKPNQPKAAKAKLRTTATLRAFAKVFYGTDDPTPEQLDEIDTKLAQVDAATTENRLTKIVPAVQAIKTAVTAFRNADLPAGQRREAATTAKGLIASAIDSFTEFDAQLTDEITEFDQASA